MGDLTPGGAQAADAAMLDICQIVVRGRTLRGRVAARVIASLHGMDRSGK